MEKLSTSKFEKLRNFEYDFLFEIILSMKFKFEIQLFQTTLNGETLNMKVIDFRKLWNFVVDKFVIWLRFQWDDGVMWGLLYAYRKVDKSTNFQPTKAHLNVYFYFPTNPSQ
jgi:hypothetical protein